MNSVNMNLSDLVESSNSALLEEVWGAIDEVVQVRDCDIYSYIPDMDADPFTDGNLWSLGSKLQVQLQLLHRHPRK